MPFFAGTTASSRRAFLGGALAATGLAMAAPARPAPVPAQPALRGAIDFHTHMFDPDLPNLFAAAPGDLQTRHAAAWLDAMRSPAAHVAHMDRYGIQSHVVGYSNAIHGISWGDAQRDLALLRAGNDRIARDWVAAYPGRFHGAFGVPTQDMRLAVPEVDRAVSQLGLKVLQISSVSADGHYFGERRFDPLWDVLHHHGVTVFIHPHGQDDQPPLNEFALSNSLGQGIEEIKVMASIIYNGVFDRYPGIKIVVAHGGGFLPHYTGRLDRNAIERPQTLRNISRMPSSYVKDFHYDSCVYSSAILNALIKVVGVDRIVLGSDYPVGEENGLGDLRATPGIDAAMLQQIAVTTPARLLGLPTA